MIMVTTGIEKWRYERAFASFLRDHPRAAKVIIKACFHHQVPLEDLPDLILIAPHRLLRMKHVGRTSVETLRQYLRLYI